MKEGCIVRLNWLVYRRYIVKLLPLLGRMTRKLSGSRPRRNTRRK